MQKFVIFNGKEEICAELKGNSVDAVNDGNGKWTSFCTLHLFAKHSPILFRRVFIYRANDAVNRAYAYC